MRHKTVEVRGEMDVVEIGGKRLRFITFPASVFETKQNKKARLQALRKESGEEKSVVGSVRTGVKVTEAEAHMIEKDVREYEDNLEAARVLKARAEVIAKMDEEAFTFVERVLDARTPEALRERTEAAFGKEIADKVFDDELDEEAKTFIARIEAAAKKKEMQAEKQAREADAALSALVGTRLEQTEARNGETLEETRARVRAEIVAGDKALKVKAVENSDAVKRIVRINKEIDLVRASMKQVPGYKNPRIGWCSECNRPVDLTEDGDVTCCWDKQDSWSPSHKWELGKPNSSQLDNHFLLRLFKRSNPDIEFTVAATWVVFDKDSRTDSLEGAWVTAGGRENLGSVYPDSEFGVITHAQLNTFRIHGL